MKKGILYKNGILIFFILLSHIIVVTISTFFRLNSCYKNISSGGVLQNEEVVFINVFNFGLRSAWSMWK